MLDEILIQYVPQSTLFFEVFVTLYLLQILTGYTSGKK